jgi:hypothetical protein
VRKIDKTGFLALYRQKNTHAKTETLQQLTCQESVRNCAKNDIGLHPMRHCNRTIHKVSKKTNIEKGKAPRRTTTVRFFSLLFYQKKKTIAPRKVVFFFQKKPVLRRTTTQIFQVLFFCHKQKQT